jgi:hypothetical protein
LTSVAQQTAGLSCLPSGRKGTNAYAYAYASPKAIPVSVSSPSPPLSLVRACEHLVIALPCHPCSTSICRALRRRCSLRASTASRSFLPSAARMFGRQVYVPQTWARPGAGSADPGSRFAAVRFRFPAVSPTLFFLTGPERRAIQWKGRPLLCHVRLLAGKHHLHASESMTDRSADDPQSLATHSGHSPTPPSFLTSSCKPIGWLVTE